MPPDLPVIRPDHLVLGRPGGSRQGIRSEPEVALEVARIARSDSRRTWWTRERVWAGMVAFNRADRPGADDQPRLEQSD